MSTLAKGEQVIIREDAHERMRKSYYLEKKSLRQVACEGEVLLCTITQIWYGTL